MERQLRSIVKGQKPSSLMELPQILPAAVNGIIAGLWFWLYWPLFDYFAVIFSGEDFRTNQLVLVGVIILIAIQLHRERLWLRLDGAPHLYLPALTLALSSSILYLLCVRFLDVNTLSATLFGLASYGLLGLWLTPLSWRQGLPAALLLIGALPFGEHMQTFIGYPLRIFTATLVRDGLAAAGVASIGIDTILVFENGVSQVDLPCSGVKSLWTGMLFLLAATWLERRPLNLRWLLLALSFAAFLIIANMVRVGVLVAVGPVAGWPLLAEMLHVPLGVLGFIAACAAAVGLLRLSPPWKEIAPASQEMSTSHTPERSLPLGHPTSPIPHLPSHISHPTSPISHPPWLGPALVVIILAMVLVYTPPPQTGLTHSPPAWEFPAGLATTAMPLKPDEIAWLTRDGADSAERRRFEWRGLTGSMILITSSTWRAHHRPERCFEVYGLSLEDSRTHLINPNFPVRFVSLGDGDHASQLSATYWFQSAGRTTDDYGTRIWADLAPQRERWVLVSILFDSVTEPDAAPVQTFYLALHEAVARYLEGERR
jgi:exosortase O